VTLTMAEILLRLGTAALLGAAIGFEREVNGHQAGMRTYALVSTGSALFTLSGAYGFADLGHGSSGDPMRVAAQIVSGIGFIGAGVIIRDGGSVRGVTTAAALWASAAIGLACGAGEYQAALLGVAVVLVTLIALRVVRDRGLSTLLLGRSALTVTYERGFGTLGPIIEAIEGGGATVDGIRIDDEESRRLVRLRVRGGRIELRDRLEGLARLPEVRDLTFDRRGHSWSPSEQSRERSRT
jgi:putative Mg2+ transporter-C (MgtC) family protein